MSFETQVILSDLFLFISGFIVGAIVVVFRVSKAIQNIYISPDTKKSKANIIKVVDDKTGEEFTYLNPVGFKQTLELMSDYRCWRKNGSSCTYRTTNKKRQNRVLFIYILIALAFLMLAGFFILDVQVQEAIMDAVTEVQIIEETTKKTPLE
jgi:hypothetical protein